MKRFGRGLGMVGCIIVLAAAGQEHTSTGRDQSPAPPDPTRMTTRVEAAELGLEQALAELLKAVEDLPDAFPPDLAKEAKVHRIWSLSQPS